MARLILLERALIVMLVAMAAASFAFWNEPGCGCILLYAAIRIALVGFVEGI